MANGGDKGHHAEKKVDHKQPKAAALAGAKTQATTKEREQ
jgi:hypothetical protein